MHDDIAPFGPDGHAEPRLERGRLPAPAAETDHSTSQAKPTGPELTEPGAAESGDTDEPSAQVLRSIEATAQAAGALQSALMELELELYRLQSTVRRASPAMAQLMQAATEMRAAGIDDTDGRW